jgi:hypothetical protein
MEVVKNTQNNKLAARKSTLNMLLKVIGDLKHQKETLIQTIVLYKELYTRIGAPRKPLNEMSNRQLRKTNKYLEYRNSFYSSSATLMQLNHEILNTQTEITQLQQLTNTPAPTK